MKTFVEFIVDASEESQLPPGQQKKLVRGFYEIVAQDNFSKSALTTYLNGQGYELTDIDEAKVRSLHKSVELLWEDLHNTDY